MRILFVCLGNICRSPAAEGVMRKLAPELTLDSAGTGGAAGARGVDLSNLRARQFRTKDFDAFDLIIAMDQQNLSDIAAMRPAGNETPLRMLATKDVPDPYYTRDFDGSLDMIEAACASLLADIADERPH